MKSILKRLRPYIFGGRQVSQRDAMVVRFINERPQGSTLLDAGAGPQRFRSACGHLKYISQDFGDYQGGDDFAGDRQPQWNAGSCDLVCDITAIPVQDGSIDSIICVEVFEHLPNPAAALAEFGRLLRAGGRALITAPFNSQYHQTPYFYYSGFSSEFYRVHAPACGLEVISITSVGDYFETISQELLRLPFLKTGILLRALWLVTVVPAHLYVWLLHALRIPAPKSPLCYVVELARKERASK